MKRMRMTKRSKTAIFGIALVAMTVWMTTFGLRDKASAADEAKATTSAPVRVEVEQPVRRPLTRVLRMPASLLPGEAADLYAKTSGYISTVVVDIGSRVGKGDTLLTIDVPEMADELRQAQAVLQARRAKVRALRAKADQAESMIATARAEVQRFVAEHDLWKITVSRRKQLLEENAVPQQDLDEASSRLGVVEAQLRIAEAKIVSAQAEKQSVEADVAVAQAEVAVEQAKLARLNTLMDYTTIRAPFDGVITERMMHPGAFVRSAADGATTPLLRIANVNYIRLVLHIPESDASYVRIGTDVEVDVKALGTDPTKASITRTAVALKADTRTMRAEVDLDNKDGHFAPGMYAQVAVTLESKQQALMIPSKAIRVRGKEVSVLVANSDVVVSKAIKLGYDDGIWVEVVSGLSGDEQVITSATSVVVPGTTVVAVLASSSGRQR